MKPSEQLSEGQRRRIDDIASEKSLHCYQSGSEDVGGYIKAGILQALDELVPEMAKDAKQAQWYRWLEKMWPNEITRLVHSHHQEGPTSSELGAAIDATIAQER